MPKTLEYYRLLYLCKMSSTAIIAQVVFAPIVSLILIGAGIQTSWAIIWNIAIYIILFARVVNAKKFINYAKKCFEPETEIIHKYTNLQMLIIMLVGLSWAMAFLLLFYANPTENKTGYHMIATACTAGIIAVAISVLGSVPKVFLAFAIPMATVHIAALTFLGGDQFHLYASIATLVGMTFIIASSKKFSEHFDFNVTQTQTIKDGELDLVHRLAKASEFRDEETGEHVNRMSYSCYLLAIEVGFSKEKADLIHYASSLHDIGKIGISDTILLKEGKFTPEEAKIMQQHPLIGARILDNSESEIIKLAKTIAEFHHEKMDGTGYPHGIKGEEIPIEARIASICDVFDALTSGRPYKAAWSNEKALAYIIEHSGTHFDTELVNAFMKIYPQIIEYTAEHKG